MSPRSEEQFSAMRQERRQAILDTALRLFARKGYSATSIEDIAHSVGSSKGLIYHYFRSKEQILERLIDDFARNVLQITDISADMTDPGGGLARVIHRWFDAIRSNSALVRLGMQLQSDTSLRKLLHRKQAEYDRTLIPLTHQIFRRLGSNDPETDTVVIGALMDGIYFNYAASPSTFPLDRVENHLIKLYCTPQKKS